ncbi:hypoxia induced protein conserved region-domain-containing protein [Apodospora peruviana]|uniref:Hypoxia induced protein conserved region-domain-containing protein n=1 Tax=Apodospora peruviana TaxID=516989 RepID=A0AAE0ID31_9PEZI|nr:hypoxia induced protein conserved region-domain-containing protein [Apodospora peruviana]
MSDRSLPSSFDDNNDFYNESGLQKVVRKIKEEPLIPIGCVLTVAAFTGAYRAMRKGDHEQVQRMFRARVAAQGFTVVAMVAGGVYFSEDRKKTKELRELRQQQDAEEKRLKWIKELEVRDQEDKALREKLDRRRKKAAERPVTAEGVTAQAHEALQRSKESQNDADRPAEGSGVLGSLGGWFGGSGKSPKDEDKPSQEGKLDPEATRK